VEILFLMIGVSLLIGTCFLAAFFWAFRTGQFDDTCTPGMRILDFNSSPAPMNDTPKPNSFSE